MDQQGEVLRIPMPHGPLIGVAWGMAVFAVFALVIAVRGQQDAYAPAAIWVAAIMGVGAVLAGARGWLIRVRAPVGLRLDAAGISGYAIAAPVAWSDIKAIGLVRTGRNGQSAALSLRDPAAYSGKLNALLTPADDAEPWHYHLTLGSGVALTPQALVRLLRDWHARYGGDDCGQ